MEIIMTSLCDPVLKPCLILNRLELVFWKKLNQSFYLGSRYLLFMFKRRTALHSFREETFPTLPVY